MCMCIVSFHFVNLIHKIGIFLLFYCLLYNIYNNLQLLQRELPDGVVPRARMHEFLSLQQSSPKEPSSQDLLALRDLIHTLPPANYGTLKYLIQHLAKVADHRGTNKMTPVSLSIVFGPNIFHCGDGLEGLQLQGFSNSTVCRMVLFNESLFGGMEEVKVRKKTSPVKPRPYSEHIADKRTEQVSVHLPTYKTFSFIQL